MGWWVNVYRGQVYIMQTLNKRLKKLKKKAIDSIGKPLKKARVIKQLKSLIEKEGIEIVNGQPVKIRPWL